MTQPMRRPMSVALQAGNELPPEAFALIREGTPKPLQAHPSIPVAIPSPLVASQAAVPSPPQPAQPVAVATEPPEEKPEAKAAKPKKIREREPEPVASNALVSMTFRVPAELPSALVRASADRKARRIRPFTQQEILSEALVQWLKRNDYY